MVRLMPKIVERSVTEEHEGVRLDQYLAQSGIYPSRSSATKALEEGLVQVNDEVETSKKRIMRIDDEVCAQVGDEIPGASIVLEPQQIPLDIRYEDDDLIVLSKQRGLVCHPSQGHADRTLANALLYHCGPENLGTMQGTDRPGIVHRLDMDTTGLMLAAKNDHTQELLQEAIRMRSVDRRYVTLVHGNIAPQTGLIDAPIARGTKDRLRMAVSEDPGARPSLTTFTVLQRFEAGRKDDGYTLLECKLYTGRTHQIRVHMSYIGHPVVGDPLYGRGTPQQNLDLDRQFLHSWSLAFEHPRTHAALRFRDALTWELDEALLGLAAREGEVTEPGREVLAALEEASYPAQAGW